MGITRLNQWSALNNLRWHFFILHLWLDLDHRCSGPHKTLSDAVRCYNLKEESFGPAAVRSNANHSSIIDHSYSWDVKYAVKSEEKNDCSISVINFQKMLFTCDLLGWECPNIVKRVVDFVVSQNECVTGYDMIWSGEFENMTIAKERAAL